MIVRAERTSYMNPWTENRQGLTAMNTEEQSPDQTSQEPAQQQNAELTRLQQEAQEFKDKYVRAYAEMENIRRRHERDRAELIKYALENVFKDFLPVLDSLEKALPDDAANAPQGNGSGADRSYYEGMLMVKRQLLEVCRKHGLEEISAAGSAFDPNVHQAIQRVESSDVHIETVGSEYAKGYLLNGRLLRPAIVSVLTPAGS